MGKSVLLKHVIGLLRPDSGRVEVTGHIVSLLELGAGFHMDLTGRENLVVNAALMGFSRKQLAERYDKIIEFSGLGDFIDQPCRSYSSGMVMRLAFSTAVHLDPEILIIDEVLAVGDAAFQSKCVERIRLLRESGNIFVCVSHSAASLGALCSTALWLEKGNIVKFGDLPTVSAEYADVYGKTIGI